ncbi:tyrosine-type recombinase/integrase [Dehalobacter restrictus]|uniref:Tyrosine-type recombinase/integrase n=1 Tax=Dehalobacter restrictus TaxID=55583 RepID=A0A857DGT5_9FIRM|nr:site-specific integrase [Dehalobacter restrictus]QGZ99445.1 tyrosine-type recombinase/integrase [Dehalobacter restrictus]
MAQLRNRGNNVWQIGIYLGKEEGKKDIYYETFYGTKPQAKIYANKLEIGFKEKRNVPKSHNMSMNELFDKFLEYKFSRIERSTYEKYQSQINKLRDLLGDLYLYGIESEKIEERLEGLNNFNLGSRTIKNHYTTLKTVMIWGAVKKYVPSDILLGIQPPMVSHIVRNVYKEDELNLFIETAKQYKHYLPVKILALTGMRIGELMGLKWKNVSLEDSKIKIVEAVNSRLRYLKDTKTENSKREIELDEETIKELKVHKNKMSKLNRAEENDFVFQSDDCEFLRYQVILKTKKRVLKKAGLHHIRIHDLRHGVGSIMLDNGESITTVAEQLGQVPATTAGNYSHALRKGKSIASVISK